MLNAQKIGWRELAPIGEGKSAGEIKHKIAVWPNTSIFRFLNAYG